MKKINVDNCHPFFTEELSNGGCKWTLASLLCNMLQYAEELFGQRDKSYTILGTEFIDDGPRIWFPENRKDIIIQLNSEAFDNLFLACYQMAQETIHLLGPCKIEEVNNLEEGVSVFFANLYMNNVLSHPSFPISDIKYEKALEAVTPIVLPPEI